MECTKKKKCRCEVCRIIRLNSDLERTRLACRLLLLKLDFWHEIKDGCSEDCWCCHLYDERDNGTECVDLAWDELIQAKAALETIVCKENVLRDGKGE